MKLELRMIMEIHDSSRWKRSQMKSHHANLIMSPRPLKYPVSPGDPAVQAFFHKDTGLKLHTSLINLTLQLIQMILRPSLAERFAASINRVSSTAICTFSIAVVSSLYMMNPLMECAFSISLQRNFSPLLFTVPLLAFVRRITFPLVFRTESVLRFHEPQW